jgi:hypothetical protein
LPRPSWLSPTKLRRMGVYRWGNLQRSIYTLARLVASFYRQQGSDVGRK